MVTVANRSQQVVTAGFRPAPAYSRVVTVTLALEPDNVWRHSITPAIGQDFILLGVSVWLRPKAVNINQWTRFEIRVGQANIANPGRLEEWELVLPVYDQAGVVTTMICYDGEHHFSWDMKKRFQGTAGRLAITGMREADWLEDSIIASFHISEG